MSVCIQKLFYVNKCQTGFKPGEPVEVIGFVMATREGRDPWPCFHLRAEDGEEDFAPIFQICCNYEFITEDAVRAGRIPTVTK